MWRFVPRAIVFLLVGGVVGAGAWYAGPRVSIAVGFGLVAGVSPLVVFWLRQRLKALQAEAVRASGEIARTRGAAVAAVARAGAQLEPLSERISGAVAADLDKRFESHYLTV